MFNLSILALNFIFLYTLYANTIIYNNPREKWKNKRNSNSTNKKHIQKKSIQKRRRKRISRNKWKEEINKRCAEKWINQMLEWRSQFEYWDGSPRFKSSIEKATYRTRSRILFEWSRDIDSRVLCNIRLLVHVE